MSAKQVIAVVGATGAQGGGLVQSILADRSGRFAVRAVTRNPMAEKAQALTAQGVEVVAADADDQASLERAFAGAHGVFAVTNFWEHLSGAREMRQAAAMAQASKAAGVNHVVWSTLEDTRRWIPLDDNRLPTLHGEYKVPHFDAKGASDRFFTEAGVPTTFLQPAFYWDNFIPVGMGPRRADTGGLVMALPLGGAKLPGIAAGDIGKVAHGIFRLGAETLGTYVGAAGEVLSGADVAAKMGRALGQPVSFVDIPFETYRGLGFPGADDLANMFQFQAILGDEFLRRRDPALTRTFSPEVLDFDAWLAANGSRIPIG